MARNLLFLCFVFIVSFNVYGQTQEAQEKYQYKAPQFLYEEKCSKCHTLERIFSAPKTENEWRMCVTQMMGKSPLWITDQEGERIVGEIVHGRKDMTAITAQPKKYEDVHVLFIDRCTKCHTMTRILKQNKTGEEWQETILRMRENAPELFLDEDIPLLTGYLAERGKLLRDDVAARIMVEKCLVCHEAGRILLERKSRKGWEDCVVAMRVLAREKFHKDWFTSDEFRLIVDLLVRTQGS
ncbi:MAG: hypothetical protein DCC43_10890 [Candidatus Brocadia sp.]|jgi:cytochrome c2|uniref:Heme protein n=1 Tax=Candidatus Brocadia fulgida TaxID=380242 RepID=A0A0M2UW87_9BACT|nr:MAG: putative heme protein [Candidatus Brocadia fulgida]MCC6325887.1 hypothetical protein [Candidatus Brocadia sp.]MCE7911477.1 hypothetical protein [Candidatus Brocadia sp. AMX3]OQY97719.1 MAG: hypothetical protein B6D35_14310 [Candidatus Brocadia sp. UTAMX2]MDG5996437.1 hypothetical protein [Candidatus Brocadia sp.]